MLLVPAQIQIQNKIFLVRLEQQNLTDGFTRARKPRTRCPLRCRIMFTGSHISSLSSNSTRRHHLPSLPFQPHHDSTLSYPPCLLRAISALTLTPPLSFSPHPCALSLLSSHTRALFLRWPAYCLPNYQCNYYSVRLERCRYFFRICLRYRRQTFFWRLGLESEAALYGNASCSFIIFFLLFLDYVTNLYNLHCRYYHPLLLRLCDLVYYSLNLRLVTEKILFESIMILILPNFSS